MAPNSVRLWHYTLERESERQPGFDHYKTDAPCGLEYEKVKITPGIWLPEDGLEERLAEILSDYPSCLVSDGGMHTEAMARYIAAKLKGEK
jgi:hypothetical protein